MWGQPSQLEQANYLRSEFDKRNPRFRMSVMAYLIERVDPLSDEFLPALDRIVENLASGVDELATLVEGLTVPEVEKESPTLPLFSPEDSSAGGPYL